MVIPSILNEYAGADSELSIGGGSVFNFELTIVPALLVSTIS